MRKLQWVLVSLFVCWCIPVLGDVHKWFDDKGIVHYSDKPNIKKESNELLLTKKKLTSTDATVKITFTVRQLLIAQKFEQLNQLLEKYQSKTDIDIAFESRLSTAYAAFEVNDQSYKQLLDSWVKATPDNYQPYLARAKFFYNQGWVARGNKWSSETKKSQIKKMKGYFIKASKDMHKVLTIDDHTIEVYSLIIRHAMSLGNAKSAESAMEKGLEINPLSYSIRYSYLISLMPRWNNSPVKAIALINNAQEYSSENPKLKLLKGIIYMDVGDRLAIQDSYNLAEKAYEKATEFGINHSITMKQGKNYFRKKDYSKSVEFLNSAIDLYSEDGDYFYWRSKANSMLHKYNNAIQDIKLAEKLSPKDKSINTYKAWLVNRLVYRAYNTAKKRKTKFAIKLYNFAIELDSDNADLFYRRARANMTAVKFGLAVVDLKKAIELDPNDYNYYLSLDYVLAKQKKWSQIISYWSKYIELNPDDSRAYVERGGAYFHKRDFKSSLLDAKSAADMGNVEGQQVYDKYKHLVN